MIDIDDRLDRVVTMIDDENDVEFMINSDDDYGD